MNMYNEVMKWSSNDYQNTNYEAIILSAEKEMELMSAIPHFKGTLNR